MLRAEDIERFFSDRPVGYLGGRLFSDREAELSEARTALAEPGSRVWAVGRRGVPNGRMQWSAGSQADAEA